VSPFSGMLWNHRVDEHIALEESPFMAAYAHSFEWGQEGDFYFEPLRQGTLHIDGGKLGKSGWGRPAFWARNRCSGQTFVCELAYSGNWQFNLDMRLLQNGPQRAKVINRSAQLFFSMGLAGHDRVLRVLAPGETVSTPAVHLGLFHQDTDMIVQATHAHVRHTVMPAQIAGYEVEIEANHRGYLCDRENEADLLRDVDVAAAVGTELYVIDAGWYGNDPNNWGNNVGDWFAGSWLPNGLEPVAKHAHAIGMRFGLWVEIEGSGGNSTLKKEHPEWLLRRNGEPIAGGRGLDLSLPAVSAWAEAEISRIIEQYDLDMYRIDHNNNLCPAGNRENQGMVEDVMWRYYDMFGNLFDRLRAKYPHVVFQNCAGGGGRLDWGTLAHFHNTELSDWMRMPRGLKILQGVTMSLPPEILLRTFGTETGELDLEGDIDTQLRLAFIARPILRGIAPSVEDLSPFLRERIAHHMGLYRTFIRPLLHECLVFHHTPFQPLSAPTPWCVLEYADPNRCRAMAGIFHTYESSETIYHFTPRGIDRAQRYQVTHDNSGQTYQAEGRELMEKGISIRLELPLSSELLTFTILNSEPDCS